MEIRDSVHGFIYLNDVEREIINSPSFQRLRNIKQLGMTYYVYPGAMHTRFEHSLGVMHVATEMYRVIERKLKGDFQRIFSYKEKEEKISTRLLKTLRLAALFHDIGHPPLSHATEELFPHGIQSHEEMAAKILREKFTNIFKKRAIKREGIDIEDVIYILTPEIAKDMDEEDALSLLILKDILAGPIDADRIDYLIRDSLHTGVIYGRFDWMRLINTLTLVPYLPDFLEPQKSPEELKDLTMKVPRPSIGVERGGVHSVEGLILARYFMFLQVYFHPVRRIYDLMMVDFLKRKLPGGVYPEDIEEFLAYDDLIIFKLLRDEVKEPGKDPTKVLAERILNRRHPRKIFEVKGPYFEEFEQEVREEISKKFEIDPELDIYVDNPEKTTYKPDEFDLFVIDDEISEELLEKWNQNFLEDVIHQGRVRSISQESQLLGRLPDIQITRVYADINIKEGRERAGDICRSIYKKYLKVEGSKDGDENYPT